MDYLQYEIKEFMVNNHVDVLNLIINGLPSIPLPKGWMSYLC